MKLPMLPFQSKPKSFAERLKADGIDFARSVPARLESSRKHALAVAGAATGAAAGFAFWRSRHEDTPSVNQDPARPSAPWKMPQPDETEPTPAARAAKSAKKPVTDTKAAAADAAGTRSK